MDAADLWVDTHQGPVRADQIVHVGTNMPQLAVYTAISPANIEKISDDRWSAETHWFGVGGGDGVDNRTAALAVVREISVRRQAGVPGIIRIDRTTNAVSFEPFS